MQLMCDAIAVLGSRHGVLWDPPRRRCGIVRFDRHTRLTELHLRAGLVIDGKEYVLPLCPEGQVLDFHDQRMTPCTMSLIGIHAASTTKLKLTIVTPFRPRDGEFSTTPVIALRLTAQSFAGIFRWEKKTIDAKEAEIFLELSGPAVAAEESGPDCIDLLFNSVRSSTWDGMKDAWDAKTEDLPQRDRLVGLTGQRRGLRFTRKVTLADGEDQPLDVAWCTHSPPVLDLRGKRLPFRYARDLADLDAVAGWARANPTALFDNASRVDGIVSRNNCSASVNHLMAQTLHSWLINTWWATDGGRDIFAVWEGTCYMLSTLDVEYTQSPFYLAAWPDLLAYQLDLWADFAKDGRQSLGERAAGTACFPHDVGAHASISGQVYSHDMEVEETANWLILMYAYWRRTGDGALIEKHRKLIARAMAFLRLCDTTQTGAPDVGVANTIDDASPAIQFGKRQVYLAVKAMAAAAAWDDTKTAQQAGRLIEERGWLGDHFATLLEKSGALKNPWSGEEVQCDQIPGWDAPHIYTVNGMAVLDMVGVELPVDRDKVIADLKTATQRCLRQYGCVHSDFRNENPRQLEQMLGLAGVAQSPGWISMNMLRDIAAFYRGVDLRHLADRYWDWQTTTNTQEPKLFFETFNGNNLSFYPRGVAVWGYFDALAGLVIDRVGGIDRAKPAFAQVRVPRLFDADWKSGKCEVIQS